MMRQTWKPWRKLSEPSSVKASFGESVSAPQPLIVAYFIVIFIPKLFPTAKLVPLAYGIKKLQIGCVVEDDKVSIDWLTEEIQNFEDLVQSVDIAAFNKI